MLALLIIICMFVTPLYFVYKPPSAIIRYFQRRWPDVLWSVSMSSNVVALTFDDAPSQYTDEIMQLLRHNGATATFFVIGSQVAGRQKTLENLVRSGNELGNHAMHDEPSRSLSDATLTEQIHSVEDILNETYVTAGFDRPPKYFRPGSGFFSKAMIALMQRLGYRLVLGSIYPHDPQIQYPNVNAAHILSMLNPGGIIVCHDRRSWTVPMLQKMLPEIKRRGYRIVTVTQLLSEPTT